MVPSHVKVWKGTFQLTSILVAIFSIVIKSEPLQVNYAMDEDRRDVTYPGMDHTATTVLNVNVHFSCLSTSKKKNLTLVSFPETVLKCKWAFSYWQSII